MHHSAVIKSSYTNVCTCTMYIHVHVHTHVLHEPGDNNNYIRQHNTSQPNDTRDNSFFQRKMVQFEPTTLYSLDECSATEHVQYASKKTSHKRAVQRCDRSRSNPVQNPFKTRTNPVRVSRFQRPVLIPVLTAVQTAVSCLCDGSSPSAARARQYARVYTCSTVALATYMYM